MLIGEQCLRTLCFTGINVQVLGISFYKFNIIIIQGEQSTALHYFTSAINIDIVQTM